MNKKCFHGISIQREWKLHTQHAPQLTQAHRTQTAGQRLGGATRSHGAQSISVPGNCLGLLQSNNLSTLRSVSDDKLPQAPLEVGKPVSLSIKVTCAQVTLNASNGLIQYHQGDSQMNNSIQLNNCPGDLETEMCPSWGMGHKLQLFERSQFLRCGRQCTRQLLSICP